MKKSRPRGYDRPASQCGLTVIEGLILLAALAVVILVAVPGSSKLLEYYRLKSATTDLLDGLQLARNEALRRGSTVHLCPSSNGRFCRTDGDWNQGWLVFTDGNGDGTVQEIELIQAFEAPDDRIRIMARGATQSDAEFTASGLNRDNGFGSGEYVICYLGADSGSRTVTVDSEGWITQQQPDEDHGCATG